MIGRPVPLPEVEEGPRAPPEPSHIEPAGKTDLLLVREILTGYRAADISHVENVMIGETRSRTHLHRALSEREIFDETEETDETSQDLETHDRTALRREITKVVTEDMRTLGSVSVTSRGPTKITANASVAFDRSTEESASRAEEFARETILRAVQRTTLRTRRSVRQRLEQETSTENIHAFTRAADTAEHVSGVYQYLERVSRAKIYCYGERETYDLLIPEPAALLWHFAMADEGMQIPIPKPDADMFATLSVDNMAENRELVIRNFQVGDIPKPPQPIQYVPFAQSSTGRGGDAKLAANKDLEIPEGYIAKEAQVVVSAEVESDIKPQGGVIVGGVARTFLITDLPNNIGLTTFTLPLGNLDGPSVPVSMIADNFTAISISVQIRCEVTKAAEREWALAAYARVTERFEEMRRSYEQAVREATALAPRDGVELPQAARVHLEAMMRTELQRAAIAIMRNAPVDLSLVAAHASAQGGPVLPAPDPAALALSGPEIRFLSQAFEWEHLAFVFYPYFWGRRSEWERTVLQTHVDPAFGEFLRAGAARVQVPVVPGFEDVVAHFMHTGEVYGGNDLPTMGDPHYVPFIDERLNATGAPGDEQPWPPEAPREWDVAQPTSLVLLRGSDAAVLPSWDAATGAPT